jgi:hypothetical protein
MNSMGEETMTDTPRPRMLPSTVTDFKMYVASAFRRTLPRTVVRLKPDTTYLGKALWPNPATSAGGQYAMEPKDHGFMDAWSFSDLDGHHWEVLWMDPKAVAA